MHPLLTLTLLLSSAALPSVHAEPLPLTYAKSLPSYSFAYLTHTEVNTAVTYRADATEHWRVADTIGDCEDIALAKRERLMQAGYKDHVRLATALVPGVGSHAVLIVTTDRGEFVLDNLHSKPIRRQDLPYQWLLIQSGSTWHLAATGAQMLPPAGWVDYCHRHAHDPHYPATLTSSEAHMR